VLLFIKAVLSIFLPKIGLTFFLITILILLFLKILLNTELSNLNLWVIILLIFLTTNLVITLLNKNDIIKPIYGLVAFVQLSIPLVLIFIFNNVKSNVLRKLINLTKKICFLFIVVGFVEFCVPKEIMTNILVHTNYLINGNREIPVSYYLGDFNINKYRLGSLFFEPLTFAFISGAYFILLLKNFDNHRFKTYLTGFIHIVTLGKMSIIITCISYVSKLIRRYSLLFVVTIYVIISILVLTINTQHLKKSPSMGNHIIGLRNGIENTKNKPILGHGIGSAGYNVFILAQNETITPFSVDKSNPFYALNNGNESAVGIITYQTGFIYTICYLALLFYISLQLFYAKQYLVFGLISGYILSLFLLESSLSIIITSFYFLIIFFYKKNYVEI
jgi:hypothetical protein